MASERKRSVVLDMQEERWQATAAELAEARHLVAAAKKREKAAQIEADEAYAELRLLRMMDKHGGA